MKNKLQLLLIFCVTGLFTGTHVLAQTVKNGSYKQIKTLQGFVENKGQIIDQNNKPNPAVKYLLNMPGLNVQLKTNGFSYDAYVVEQPQQKQNQQLKSGVSDFMETESISTDFHRIDIEFIDANASPQIIAEEPFSDYMNYYTTGTSENGAIKVNHYEKVTYKNLYPGIDLVFYARPGTSKPVEYNFIVHPMADISLIKWKYNGSTDVKLLNGNIQIQTAFGFLNERIPLTYEQENAKSLALNYKCLENNIFSFDKIDYNRQNTLIIDPIPDIKWATYFGGSTTDQAYSLKTDASGNVFVTGFTQSAAGIATTGAYQTTYAGSNDIFIVMFNTTGSRIWATYFGGSGFENGNAYGGNLYDNGGGLALDLNGNIFISGFTTSTAGIATTGAYQVTSGGSYDAFLAKFSSSGTRLWSTFLGGSGIDMGYSVATDATGNAYITGRAASTAGIATTGAYKTTFGGGTFDAFVAKFSPSGSIITSTYYGGSGEDMGKDIAIDINGNVIVTGFGASASGIATTAAYQTTFTGTADAFVAKFNSSVVLLWGTYFGGSLADYGQGIATDANANYYAIGYTASTSGITSTGAYQTTYGGGTSDAFLVKFSTTGSRLWSTYMGGILADFGRCLAVDQGGNVVISGYTTSTSGIASTGAYQTTFGGGTFDAFISKFNSTGILQWSTYYGGSLVDNSLGITTDISGSIFFTGQTTSTSGIATTGAYQTANAGTNDVFLVKLQDLVGQNNAGISQFAAPSAYLCAGNQDVKVGILNAGLNTIDSVKVMWQINGLLQIPLNIKTPILSGTSRVVTLGNANFPLAVLKTIKVWTSMPNGVTDIINVNDTIVVQRKPGLNGIYTIGGKTPDYPTFSAAVTDLNDYGICGPVEFLVRTGTYNERFSINPITGTSSINTISFIGTGKDSCIITYSGTSTADMATVLLNGTDQTSFRNMTIKNLGATYGTAIWFSNTSDSNSFINLKVVVDTLSTSANVNAIVGSGSTTAATSDGNTGSSIVFDSVEINGGYHGIRINGPNTTTIYAIGNSISHCTFSNQYQYGIYLHNQSSSVFTRNLIKPLRFASSYSLTFDYSSNLEISNNVIFANDCGLNFNYVNRYLVNSTFPSRVYNNMVSSSSGYGLYCNQSSSLKLWHNSFSSDPVVSVVRFVGCLTNDLINNHIQNRGNITGRYALYSDNITAFTGFNYNNYYSTGSYIYIGSTDYGNIPVLQAAFSQFNQNSYNQDPLFISATNLHTSINLSGTYVGIDQDIDDDFRNTISPVLGADEVNIPNNAGIARLVSPVPAFCAGSQNVIVKIGNYGNNVIDSVRVFWKVNGVTQPDTFVKAPIAIRGFMDVPLGSISFTSGESKTLKIWTSLPNGAIDPFQNNDTLVINVRTGLSGTYKIGGTNPDYPDFSQAVSALNLLGVCSPVVFLVSAGTYSERIIMSEIKNASPTNTITFKGAGKNSTNLSFTGANTADWVTLMLKGTDFVTFRDMTISAMGTTYGIGVLLTSKADSNKFVNLTIQTSTTSTSANLAGIAVVTNSTNLYATPGLPGNGNVFDSLEVNGGYYGVYLAGNSYYQTVCNSTFTDQSSGGIDCSNQNYLKVFHNIVTTSRTTSFSSINISSVTNLNVHSNTINTVAQFGIYLQNANFSVTDTNFPSVIYNNMVSNTVGYSLYCENSHYISILHNSFRSVGTSATIYAAAYFKSSGYIDLRNNQIRNDNPASYAVSADMSTFDFLDYNNYYSFGSFVLIGTPFPNLTALRNGFPTFNKNSYSQNPQYISLTNLHTSSFLSGIYVGINEDIDGDPRCPVNLSIGADDDHNWSFIKPIILANHINYNYFENYPLLFSNNVPNPVAKPVVYAWYIDGTYYTDSSSIYYTFSAAGSHTVKLVAKNCAYADSTQLIINVLSGIPKIMLLGYNPDSITVFKSYYDPGFICKNFLGDDISAKVVIVDNIDTAVLGSYFISYKVQDAWGNKDSVTRTVEVVDDVAPVLSLIGADTLVIEVFGYINDLGAKVTDNYYSKLTVVTDSSGVNKNIVGIYKIIYTSTDGSGNIGTISRWVKVVDTGLPLITLIGTDTIEVDVFTQYIEPGATVTDNYCASDLQWQVDIYPPTNILQTYTLTYTATDCFGNAALPVKRFVKVVDNEEPSLSLNGLAFISINRWQTYTDDGVSIDDNYYAEDTLQSLLNVTSNLDVQNAGIYNICYQVTDPSGNKSVKLCRNVKVLESTSSINNNSATFIHVYPNPGSGLFLLDFPSKPIEQAVLTVFDIAGKEVYSSSTTNQHIILNLEVLEEGIYLLKVRFNNELSTLKINLIR